MIMERYEGKWIMMKLYIIYEEERGAVCGYYRCDHVETIK